MPPIVTIDLSPTEFRKNCTSNIKCQVKSELQEKEWLFDDALGLIGKKFKKSDIEIVLKYESLFRIWKSSIWTNICMWFDVNVND